MEGEAVKYFAIAFTVLGMVGSALGVSWVFCTLLNSIARNPSADTQLLKGAFVGAGLVEAMGLFSFLIAILLLFFV